MDNPKSLDEHEVPHLTTQDGLDKVLKEAGHKLVIVMFHAQWCAPSLMMGPVFENVSLENKDCVFIRVDTNKAEQLSDTLDINVLPSFFFYRNTEKIDEMLGANETIFMEKMASNNPEQ